jgi:hypothetical protein
MLEGIVVGKESDCSLGEVDSLIKNMEGSVGEVDS